MSLTDVTRKATKSQGISEFQNGNGASDGLPGGRLTMTVEGLATVDDGLQDEIGERFSGIGWSLPVRFCGMRMCERGATGC